ncbi:MAG: bifunctional homocysteine S-methyltransferase/methylenetetrahydrofolate reductase [Ignavibacteria bacterium CG_4_8_14_3_um_filter_37_9]|nr:bifunctional homocysteine S-methyltransferase/methylenetetrahydrofolate reductase [Ignavibacteria bacterium]OIO14085.1 MAG: bifunctional homocysteine S-methyltransferase/methylenetetrahydrofolate reductase [Ignavibacteria bacterium CG1_02_37_35]PIP79013.1 MAG: bifunctional homocysteine S-methyltransferase/methylenetetrahydrofolate reductase [Ignavibacteria bacterium CG22_combo_CG10-13_8_21_14_all_37_15]PIW98669.1 MAG: bifunctional homocysteine S-methyltransferase/methylenetetrahydrofolate red
MKSFRERLGNELILFDGGTGTYLYEKGIYINRCFDELNLTNPELVTEVHCDYINAGADIIETNTFGANSFKLTPHGLGNKVYEINLRGAKLAKTAAKESVLVAGAVGPLGVQIEPLGKLSFDEAKDVFKEQIKGLLDGGVDLIVLETFALVKELIQAIRAVRELNADIPIVAQVTINESGTLLSGAPLERFIEKLKDYPVDAVGLNCSVGPKAMLDALENLRSLTDIPISVQPNAGLPQNISGRNIYMTSPEYMAEYAKRFIQTGANIVGGCCGTNPTHIKAMRKAVQALQPVKKMDVKIADLQVEKPSEIKIYEKNEKSRLSNKLLKKEFVKLVELVSPKGVSPSREVDKARKLYHAGIDAINIPDGPRASARMSALALAAIIQKEVGIETVLHIACRDRNVIGMQSDLLGAWALGLRNILAITGDPPKLGNYPDATAVFDVDAIGLTNIINRLNHGLDIASNPIGDPTGFCVGVGVNPGAINLDEELKRLEWKIEAGAEFMITQPVFDIKLLEHFMKRIEKIKLPLICGIWPLVSFRNAEFMNNEVPGASVPQKILQRMKKMTTKEEGFNEGVKIARETFDQVKTFADGVQISAPLGRIEAIFDMIE